MSLVDAEVGGLLGQGDTPMGRNVLCDSQCLCFELSPAPFYFSKVMKAVFSQLSREGVLCQIEFKALYLGFLASTNTVIRCIHSDNRSTVFYISKCGECHNRVFGQIK